MSLGGGQILNALPPPVLPCRRPVKVAAACAALPPPSLKVAQVAGSREKRAQQALRAQQAQRAPRVPPLAAPTSGPRGPLFRLNQGFVYRRRPTGIKLAMRSCNGL